MSFALLGAIAVMALAPTASAATDECTMTNSGTIVSVAGTGTFCGDCHNTGTMILVGGSWQCEGRCRNDGVFVAVASNDCFGEGPVYVCKGRSCGLELTEV